MDDQERKLTDLTALWKGSGGQAWVALQDLLDQLFQPIEDLLVDAVSRRDDQPRARRRLRNGQHHGRRRATPGRGSPLHRRRHLGADDRRRARSRGAGGCSAVFIVADAQTTALERASFDAIISRFGVMFFGDPVCAFTNLRGAARAGARLRCVVWRSAAENPFMTTAERAAAPLLPDLPARRPDEPGQFAFADRDRVRRILDESGWSEIDIQPIDVPCALPENALVRYLHPARSRRPLPRSRRMTSFARGSSPRSDPPSSLTCTVPEVRFTAACWMVGARA